MSMIFDFGLPQTVGPNGAARVPIGGGLGALGQPMPAQQVASAPPQTGFMAGVGKFNDYLQDNRSAMMGMAQGFMGGNGQVGGMGPAMQGYMFGQPMDEQRREKTKNANATESWLRKNGYGDEDIAFFKANPQMMAQALKPATANSSQQKIDRLVASGVDPVRAQGIVDGRFKTSINPMTGERVFIDMATGQGSPVQMPQQQEHEYETPQPAQTLWDMVDEGTGIGATVRRGLSDTAGQIPGSAGDVFRSPETVRAQQNLDLFKRDLVRTLSLNPRFPVAEQKRIEGLLPVGAFTAPETLKVSMQELDAEFARIEAEVAAGASNPSAPVEQRQADAQTLRFVRQARARLGVPQGGTIPPATSGQTSNGVPWSVEQ